MPIAGSVALFRPAASIACSAGSGATYADWAACSTRWSAPTQVSPIGFARAANTKPGLIVLMTLMALLTVWSMIGGHRFVAVILLALGATLGAQLWRIEGGQVGARPTPPSPGTA